MDRNIRNFIIDWDGFERLVSKLCETGDVTVERDVVMVGKSGAPRQIDVVIKSKQGLVEHLVIIECKYWNRPVSRANVDSFAISLRELNASKGIIFSVKGFQKGAIQQASSEGIELFNVRGLKDSELFNADEPLDRYTNLLWRSIQNLQFPGNHCWEKDLSMFNIEIVLGDPSQTSTPILNSIIQQAETLEQLIDSWSRHAATQLAFQSRGVLFCGAGGVRQVWKNVVHTADYPIEVPFKNSKWVIPKISYDLGITIWQQHRETSRNDILFLLAIEDCIRGTVKKAIRFQNDRHTNISSIANAEDISKTIKKKSPQIIALMEEIVPFNFDKMEKSKFYDKSGVPSFVPPEAV